MITTNQAQKIAALMFTRDEMTATQLQKALKQAESLDKPALRKALKYDEKPAPQTVAD